ncbi:Circadian input kinase A [uncultured Synechococcales cyanobacterium]|uniref:histidine kinase n=1 Tax=uncultured Synechococcales cyanobacterium TaxID=1936017 RepID=A0A6J4VF46_9CYAN|nr:Circadian input kinase A [uncultured Synechococcales cyanobacterium]
MRGLVKEDKFFQQLKMLYKRVIALQHQASARPSKQELWLPVVLEELNTAFEELQVAEEELQAQNEQLAAAHAQVEVERQRYQELFEFAPDGYLITDLEGIILEANHAAAQLLNISQQLIAGKPLATFIAESSRRTLRSQLTQLKLGQLERLQEWELPLQPRQGMAFDVAITVTTAYNREGRLGTLRWLLRDIAERKQAAEVLRQQTERERLVVEIAQRIRQSLNLEEILSTTVSEVQQFLQSDRVFIYRFEPDWGGIVVVESVGGDWKPILGSRLKDPTFVETYVQPYKEGRIQATEDIYAGELTQCYVDFLAEFQVRATLVVPVLQGEELWGLLVANACSQPRKWQQLEINLLKQLATQLAIALQQSELYQQVQTELKERQRAEGKIRQQAALLDIATDAILVQSLENQILFWNQGAGRLYGWKTAEVMEQNLDELLYKEPSPQLEVAQKTVVEKGEWQGELHQVTKAGKDIIIASRWSLMRDEQGQPKAILTVNSDITQQKQLEAQALRRQRMESLGTLAGGVAHDLNNVLAPILLIGQLLKSKLPDEQSQQLLTILETNVKRGADLLKQVLTFARGSEGKRTIVQADKLILEVEQIAKETFSKSIEVSTHISPALWPITANATQLHQVLMNLCLNARDAMPNGGTLTITAENLFIDAHYVQINPHASVGPYIVITVSDTGMGILPEVLDKISEPFFTTKELGQGTGLGLSTALGIIKSHSGFMNVSSKVGQGTQVKVYLPAVEAMNQKQTTPALVLSQGQGELILVVDDEAAIREITKTSLEAHNYRVLTASDGIEAVTLYAQHQDEISIVLTDMMMPLMDGPTAIRILQRMNSQVKIVATSGLASREKLTEVAGTGIKTFLSKPYTAEELLNTLHQILKRK